MGEKATLDHIHAKFDALEKALEELREEALQGFPDKDPKGHRVYHEAAIKKAAFWSKVRSEVILHIAKALGLAALVFIGAAVLHYTKVFL